MNYHLLDNIQSPEDIKNFTIQQLQQLASEVRQRIIEVLSVYGGHLSSNLGSIEFTIALHNVFGSPADKFIWDTSHQSYAHKLLTGRNGQFDTIRAYKGLSGFTNPSESPHDHFYTGHAGTALSSALGVAKSRDLSGGNENVIPIIGDASLTCGLTLEALNNVPRDLRRFVIILNDNKMAISQNVGAISDILSRLLSNPKMNKFYREAESFISRIPNYGSMLANKSKKILGSIQNLVSPAMFFEQYGISYLGPFDGHDLKQLTTVFNGIKNSEWPSVVHIITNKGQGMEEALKNPTAYHGVKSFNLDTGKFHLSSSTKKTFPKIFGKRLVAMAENDSDIVAITPAMLSGSSLEEFMKKFPDRCIDVGIAEGHAVTLSGGIACKSNKKVFTVIYSTFIQRALDNIYHDICLQNFPVIFCIDRSGLTPADGLTHHGIYDISFLNAMPNMIITQPRDGHVLEELMISASSWKHPTAIRYPNKITSSEESVALRYRECGKGEIIAEGSDIMILALGHMCETALKVRENLIVDTGITATVVDPVFAKPFDTELMDILLKTHKHVITIEEHSLIGGLGSITNNFLMTNGYNDITSLNFGIPDTFVEQGNYDDLIEELSLTPQKITQSITEKLSLRKASLQNT